MEKMRTERVQYPVKSEVVKRIIADQRLRHDFNVCQRLPKKLKPPTPAEFRRNQEAVVMLAYVAAAYKFVDELPTELEAAGMYRHDIKRQANRIEPILKKASRHAEDALKAANNGKASTGYYDVMDAFYEAIDNCISLEAPERAYNILLAMCRNVGIYNQRLDEYHFVPAYDVAKIPSILANIPIEDHKLDNIIDMVVRPIVFNREY